jgi:recombinational DNA repair ATPase RecF
MLLDDVMSELDSARRELLADVLSESGQSVITTTDPDHVPGSDTQSVQKLAVMPGVILAPQDEERSTRAGALL